MHRLLFILTLLFFPYFIEAALPGTVTAISQPQTNDNTLPQVAVDPKGNALSVWQRFLTSQIFASRFNASTKQWSIVPIQVTTNAVLGVTPVLGVDQNGNGLTVFVNPVNNQVFASRFNVTTLTWSSPVQISINTVPSQINSFPVLSVNASGNAAALWLTFPSIIQGATFNATTLKWSAPIIISRNGGFPQVSVSTNNTAVAVFLNFSTSAINALNFIVP